MAKTKKRILALVLTLAMVFTALAVTAVADEPEHSDECTIDATACTCDPKEEDGTVIHEADCGAWICVEGCGFKKARDAVAAFRTAYKDLPAEEGGVTAENAADILAAVESFKGLSSYAKTLLGDAEAVEANLETLEAAAKEAAEKAAADQAAADEAAADQAAAEKAAADQAAADEVIRMIEDLPEAKAVTLDVGNAVNAAMEAYEALAAEQAELVTNAGKLDELNKALAVLTAAAGAYEDTPLTITGANTVAVGSTITLNSDQQNGTWASNNTKVATVLGNGSSATVTGVHEGTARITYSYRGWFGLPRQETYTVKVTGSNTAAYFYILNPNLTDPDAAAGNSKNWYYAGMGTVTLAPAVKAGNGASYKQNVDSYIAAAPTSSGYPDITYNGKTYAYDASGMTVDTYTITWVKVSEADGATGNLGQGTLVNSGTPTWHVDGVAVPVTENDCFVFFNVDGSTVTTSQGNVLYYKLKKGNSITAVQLAGVNDRITIPDDKEFDGWYLNADCTGTEVDPSTYTVNANTTFYAKLVDKCQHTDVTWTTTTPANCVETGLEHGVCDDCGKDMGDRVIPIDPTNHKGGCTEEVGKKAATCTETGYTGDKVCDACHAVAVKGEETPALGHDMETHEAHAATCVEKGNDAYYTCKRCNGMFRDEAGETAITEIPVIDLATHTMGPWIEDAGTDTHSRNCSFNIPAHKETRPHTDWDKWVDNGDWTEIRTCPDCHATQTRDIDKWIDETIPESERPNDGGDGIPDKFQIKITYKSADTATGTVAPAEQFVTIKNADGNPAETGTITFGAEGKPAADYAFDTWTSNDITIEKPNEAVLNQTSTVTVTTSDDHIYEIVGSFDTDKIGPKDPTGTDPEKPGDGIPDKYQAVVNFKAGSNGTLKGNTTQVITLKDANGNYAEKQTVEVTGPTASANSRYDFDGWTGDAKCNSSAFKAEMKLEGGKSYTVTANFSRRSSGGGSHSGGTTIKDPEVPLGGLQLNKDDHFAYIKGYADGTVRPNNFITRAQVATIFYRLMTKETRTMYFSESNDFSDVSDDYWANKAISTLSNAGIITGFSDGTFRPNAFITRAQFAAIAARFSVVTEDLPNPFSDVPEGYWAEDLIAFAADVGWVNGYADGTFRPTANITRAAAMKLINNVLERQVDEDGLLKNATQWNDCTPDDWCYYIVMEATNSHDWERRSKKSLVEDWTALTADPVWDE